MFTSTITVKGQVTLPSKLRKELKVKPADRVMFVKKGKYISIQKLPPIESLFGSLSNPKVKSLSISEMNKMIEKGMFSKDDIA